MRLSECKRNITECKKNIGSLMCVLLLVSCSTTQRENGDSNAERPQSNPVTVLKDQDFGPTEEIDMSHVPDAVPKYEQRNLSGNKNPYDVLGKTYYLMQDERAYKERGIASWYGYKFNGEHTSNGEVYDMFSMTAAHKTLPIPSYVRVTNLNNQKSVVVRVNDRGPFFENRIIDLSYAAAQRLGITRDGTGYVEVEVIVPDDDPRPPLRKVAKPIPATTVKPPLAMPPAVVANNPSSAAASNKIETPPLDTNNQLPQGTYWQVGAFAIENSANQLAASLRSRLTFSVVVNSFAGPQKLFRVRVGPFKDVQAMQKAREELLKLNIVQMHTVYQ